MISNDEKKISVGQRLSIFFAGLVRRQRKRKCNEIHRYAEKWDTFLMIIGGLAAILTGASYPVILVLFNQVMNAFVDIGKSRSNETFHQCLSSVKSTASPVDLISRSLKYYFLTGILTLIFYWIAWFTWMITSERQILRMRFALLRNILRQEMAWFDLQSTGQLTNRLIDDLDKIKDGLNEKVAEFISYSARMISCLVYALIIGWKLTLVYLSVSPLIILAFNFTIRVIIKYTRKEAEAFAAASTIAHEVLQNIRMVTAFHGQKNEQERFTKNLLKTKSIGIRKGFAMGLCSALNQIFFFLALALTFWYGPHLIRTDCLHYSPGQMLSIFVACMVATSSAAQFLPNLQNFAQAFGSANAVFELIDRESKIDSLSVEGEKPSTIVGDIEFDQVDFTYPARPESQILRKLSIKIPSKQTVALVGSSGCGKSTIIQLIQRFYDADGGRILLDGKDLRSLNVAWLRSQIGIVSQEPVLFPGSIEENIRFGKADATDEEIEQAARLANAHEFISVLPEKYKTHVGDKLSGGQKQRVAIARALVSNPKILLLDEATSALDNTSESIVQDALNKAKEGRTTIIIAHRLSTIRHADLIIALEEGQMVEYGTHETLMMHKGLYYELLVSQDQQKKSNDSDDEEDVELPSELLRQQSNGSDPDDEEEVDGDNSEIQAKKCYCSVPFTFRILRYNLPEWYWIVLGSICSMINGAIQSIFTLLMSYIFGLFAEPNVAEQKRLTIIYASIIFAVGVLAGLADFLASFSFAKSGEALTMRMRTWTFAALLRQEMAFFDSPSNSVGALVTRLSSDSSALKGLSGVRIGTILQAIGAIVGALIIAFNAGWKLTLVSLCFVPFLILNGILQGQKHRKAEQGKQNGSLIEQAGQCATVAIENIRTVAALQQEEYFLKHYENAYNQDFKKQICRLQLVALGSSIAFSVMYFLQGTNFAYGSHLVMKGEMEFHQVYRIFTVIVFAMMAVGRAMAMIPDYSKGKAAALRILRLHQRQSQIDPNDSSGIILNDVQGQIEFHNVTFRYPSRATLRILRKFSLKCFTSGTTALVGPSGSGKSTSIALLQRFYDPCQGKIFLDGHDIRILNLQWLRSLMGFVQQEPVLFNLSIRENIAYGYHQQEITQDQIEQAAKMANIHSLICSLPQGYDTLCGTNGNQLSGGQKQRIAIARALIRSPKILLLDEATSALDNKSEQVVQTALDQAKIGRTCLTIAHRLSTIQNSEQIDVVHRGKICEQGTHEELLKLNGIYSQLNLAQQRST